MRPSSANSFLICSRPLRCSFAKTASTPSRRRDIVGLCGKCSGRRHAENNRQAQSETFNHSTTRFASNSQSSETVSFGFTVIFRSCIPKIGCQALIWYVPAGRSSIANDPLRSVTA